MFDVCNCSCYENGIARLECKCDKHIPVLEWDAIVDQKYRVGKGHLGRIVVQTTAARKRTAQRKTNKEIKRKTFEKPPPLQTAECLSETASTDSCEGTCTEFKVPKELESKCQNRYSYDQLAILSHRYRVINRATAAIVNAALQDMGHLTDENMLER